MLFRRPTVTIALCLLSLALASRRASADLVLTLEASPNPVTVGDILSVDVYLNDITTSNDSPLNISSGQSTTGLSNFGFTGTFSPSVFSLLPSPAISFVPGNNLAGSLSVVNGSTFTVTGTDTVGDENIGAFGTAISNGFHLKLGTLQFKASDVSTGSDITIGDLSSSSSTDFKLSGAGADLALFPNGKTYSTTVQVNQPVSAVPEPGSMSLVALTGAGSLWLAHRRRRRSAK